MEPRPWEEGKERTGPSSRAASLGHISVFWLRACIVDRYKRTAETTFYKGEAGAPEAIWLDPDWWRE